MFTANSKVDSRVNVLSIIGPLFVILPVLLLIIKESPFYIDIAATSSFSLLICWRYRLKGLAFASLLLLSVMSYDFLLDGTPVTLWNLGLGFSLLLSFLITALASGELKELFQTACMAASSAARQELEEWKSKITALLKGNEDLLEENQALKMKLLPLQDGIKSRAEQVEMFERLLGMARNELVEQTEKRHHFEEHYLKLKHKCALIEADAVEEQNLLGYLNQKLEEELKVAQENLHEKGGQESDRATALMNAEWKMRSLQEEFDLKAEALKEEAREKSQALGEQLEALIDRLKHLQTERDELEKALAEALGEGAPAKESKELKRVWGLHNQLRSQFEEKTELLNQTRRELFLSQEAHLVLQKAAADEEEALCQAFEDHILALEQELQNSKNS